MLSRTHSLYLGSSGYTPRTIDERESCMCVCTRVWVCVCVCREQKGLLGIDLSLYSLLKEPIVI